ncbi:MAG: starch-binding protein [Ruminococcus sp.]|nr:starch-binding protein [Ruminococcus sp.]
MKKFKFGRRVLALVLVLIMVTTFIPTSVFAAVGDIATGTAAGNTGINNGTLGVKDTINWPVKIYDYLEDGMLFEYSSFNGAAIYDESYSNAGGGLYGGGAPMPITTLGSDYTADSIYKTYTANYPSGNYNPSNNYTKIPRAAVANSSPQHIRLTRYGDTGYANYCVADFSNDWNGAKAKNSVRYMVIVYRSSGITASGSTPAFHMNTNVNSVGNWFQAKYTGTFQNSTEWKYMLIDLKEALNAHQNNASFWDNNVSTLCKIFIRLNMDDSSDYFDLSHVAFFSNTFEAEQYGKAAVAFDKNPGTRLTINTTSKSTSYGWNAGNNLGFGMLLPSSGGKWALGGGDTSSTMNNGYNAYRIGYTPYAYGTGTYSSVFNDKRVDRNGRTLGADNQIYFISSTYASQDAYKNKYPNDYQNGFNMADLNLDGYTLLTHATQGLMTVGLLEGELQNGRPVYREEAVSYIAEMLEKTLVIPQRDSSGKYNYNFVKGQESSQYGTANGKNLDLAQALRNCLGITFTSGENKGKAPTFGAYAETKAKASSLIGEFLDVKDNIKTCMDAAYFLLNNLFVDNSYNQLQTDYKYLTLGSAEMSNGKEAYVFDAGFSNGANNADLTSGTITQDQYKAQSQSAVEYSSLNQGGDGTISMGPVQGKDMFYYSGSNTTTRFPFLPVTNATGDYAGQTKSYYMMEDGYRSYTKDGGTYINRNFDYVLASNGEFVFNEEDGLFFEFEGDDDVYLFINDQLVLDLGGAHSISNVNFQVNDYVNWAREVVANPGNYSAEELKRAQALDLVDGEIAKFDFYYMERHGYGANMRIVTNMRVTDPALRCEKTAYQFGEQVEVGGIVNPNAPIEYNFKAKNAGNTKLYNLTFDDSNIGVKLNPTDGLLVKGDDTPNDLSDDVNGYYITDARGETLEANDLTAVVTGYMPDSENGDYVKDLMTGEYSKVAAGAGTHVYTEITIHFNDNNALKVFLKTLEGDGLDDGTIDDELTQSGSGLWVDAEVTFKGIYYTLTDDQAETGAFDNTVNVTATTKSNPDAGELLKSSASHRVYVAGIPYYYQWAEHNLFVPEQRILDDATKASKTTGNKLSEYAEFFDKVKGDTNIIYTTFCDKYGRRADYSPQVEFYTQNPTGDWGCLINYSKSGTHEFYLLMRLQSTGSGINDVSGLNHGDYAIVRVMIHSTKTQDSTYVLDYGLKTEELDANGELFKNDDLLGAQSGTAAKLMGINTTGATYLDPKNNSSEFNRIDFEKMPLDEKNRIDVKGDDNSIDGYFTFNMKTPDNGKLISYNANNGKYSLSAVGTVPIHVEVPIQWRQAYLYYWYDGGADNGWPGTAMNLDRLGHFSLSIPGDVPHVIISNGQQQTVNIDINPGEEAWITIDGTTNADGKLIASTEYHTQDGIIHAQVPDDWEEVCLYYWDEYDNNNGWPGEKLELDENGFYTTNIPGNVHYVIINNGDKGKQTSNQPVYAGKETWITVNNNNPSYNEETNIYYYGATSSRSTEKVKMHATVPEDWETASIFYWNSNGSGTGVEWPGIAMEKQSDGTYTIDNIPADVTNVIINDGKKVGAKQTNDLLITPGLETWINVSDTVINTTVEATVPENYGDVNFYFFGPNGDVGPAWPGTAVTDTDGDGVYTMKAPVGATKVIVNNGNGTQSQNLMLTPNKINSYTIVDGGIANTTTKTKLLISVPDDWGAVQVHHRKDTYSTNWDSVTVTDRDESGRYVCELDGDSISFFISNGNNSRQTANINEFCLGAENKIDVYTDNNSAVSSTSEMPTGYTVDITYGEDAEKLGFTFTPTDFMDSMYNLFMAITVHETTDEPTPLGQAFDINKEVQMFKKVTVLPANVVYYEDDFTGVKYDTTGSANSMVHIGKGSGSLSQNVDQKLEYGQDPTYQNSLKPDYSGDSQTQVSIGDTKPFATFEFTGTGFEIIGRTNAIDASTARVVVKDASGKVVRTVAVITEFDNDADDGDDAINQVPIVRVNGLEFGKYTVEINGVPVYDFTNFVNGKPSVKESWLIIDGIRIFQPLDNSSDITDSENLALNKSYDAIDAERGYNANLTDGAYATAVDFAKPSEWFGFNKALNATDGVGYVTVDLEKDFSLERFRMHLSADDIASSIGQPQFVEVAVSSDGIKYDMVGNLNVTSSAAAAYWAELNLSTAQTGRYVRFYVYNNADGHYWNFLNEVEVYGTQVVEAGKNDAYLDTEDGADFEEIRNLISDRQAFAIKYDDTDGLSVSGGTNTWIENRNNTLPSDVNLGWTNNIVNSVNDYLLAGPNNEVYLQEVSDSLKSALAFYVAENGTGVHNLQIAARAIDYGQFNAQKATGVNAELQYGAYVNGEYVWKTLSKVTTSTEQYYTIPYTECPYDAENDRYQVVIRVADTTTPGMASFTSLKYNGLKLCTLNSSEVPDVIYDYDELGNTLVDSTGKTLETSKFVDFIGLVDQMTSDKEDDGDEGGTGDEPVDPENPTVVGTDTSSLGVLADTFTANSSKNFALSEDSKFYIVTQNESSKPSDEVTQTVKLVQSQFASDSLPSAEPMEIVWGLEEYATDGDIVIYADSSLGDEEYKLVVAENAKVYSKDVDGLLYGLNTLQKHFRKAGTNAIKGFTTVDKPDTKERTVHLDIARKYLTKDWIKNYIREMSWMGYNALELHLSEDGGFRSDFWDTTYYPAAAGNTGNDFSWAIGSMLQPWCYDCPDADSGKYLTAAELVEICETAKEYHIEIIPSFDTPAHVGWLTKQYDNLVKGGNTSIKNFKYGGTTYTLPDRINYRTTNTYDYAVLDLSDANVQRFALAMYTDIAAFFREYAGSTKFNICGDEVGLNSTDRWDYADFVDYVNSVNSQLNSMGYTVRMYNDFLDRSKYVNAADRTVPNLASNIEIVYWDAPTVNSLSSDIQRSTYWVDQGRVMHSGVQNWTYYVLRIFNDPSYTSNSIWGMDARHPNNTWWSFSRNTEDRIYNEWNPTRFSEINQEYTHYYSGDQLASGYFMVWCDYAGLNTEVEMWNGVNDSTKYASTSGGTYSLIDRMWSNAIKQWNWDINSSVDFASYETLRDSMGDFPGYVATPANQRYANASVLPESTEITDTAYLPSYTVTFKNYDGTVVDTQSVKLGGSAVAPTDPERPSDGYYTYTFKGWDKDFTNITGNLTVTALYDEIAIDYDTSGYLELKVSGGTDIQMSVDGGPARPLGKHYYNHHMDFGKQVNVTAVTTNDNAFVGWINGITGDILTTERTYTFYTTGNDVLIAMFKVGLEGMNTVTFRNDKTDQIVDIQYYSPDSDIVFPEDPSFMGYEFAQWDHTEEEIKALLAQGKDVTVRPVWEAKDVYVSITVNGGTVTKTAGVNTDGKYLAYKTTIVTAKDAPEGKMFSHWEDADGNILSYDKEYKFYPYKNTELTAMYVSDTSLKIDIVGVKPVETTETFDVYFTNNWLWTDVSIYYWGVDGAPVWPGFLMEKVDTNQDGHDVYKAELPVGVTGMIINGIKNDGSGSRDQTPDITEFVDGRGYSMSWNDGNIVVIDDSRVEETEEAPVSDETNKVYLKVLNDWKDDDNAVYAAYVWDEAQTDYAWYKFTHISGDIYLAEIPVRYTNIILASMNSQYDESQWDIDDTTGILLHKSVNFTVSPEDEDNMVILKADGGYSSDNVYTTYFVNDCGWENVNAYYTDDTGTQKAMVEYVETDKYGNDIYAVQIPANATNVMFTDGKEEYTYTFAEDLSDRTIFQLIPVEATLDYDVLVNADIDSTTLGDSNTIFFSWSVPEASEYTFVSAGVLFADKNDYSESTFIVGTLDKDVAQFVPAKKYQTSTGVHSITKTGVETGDEMVARAFVMYRDADNILKIAYSDIVTAKK